MERVIIETKLSYASYNLSINKLGEDYNIIFTGGKEHIGSCVLAIPRPSLKNPTNISVTSSVLNITGHKDEFICKYIAESFAKRYNSTTICSGGFHFDNITQEKIDELFLSIKELLNKILV